MNIAIVGGGICGLSLASNLHERGISCRVYERAPEIKELGVGITLLPHAKAVNAAAGPFDAGGRKETTAERTRIAPACDRRAGEIIAACQRCDPHHDCIVGG